MRKLAYCVCEKKGANQLFACIYSLTFFLLYLHAKLLQIKKSLYFGLPVPGSQFFFCNKIHTYRKYLKALSCVVICAFFYIINLITVYIVICTAFFAVNAKPKILAKIIANTNELQHIPVYFITIV